MSVVFVRTALKSNPALFRLVVRFNQQSAATLHTDHLAGHLDPALFQRLLTSPRGEAHLSHWVMRQFGLSPDGFWSFSYAPQRLALLEPGTLQSLVTFAGAAVHHQRLSSLIGGSQIRDAKLAVGDAAWNFAQKRASLLIGARGADDAAGSFVPTRDVPSAGLSWLKACLGSDSPELLKRTSLKLPLAMTLSGPSDKESIDRDRAWKVLKRILLTEIAPELAPCFN